MKFPSIPYYHELPDLNRFIGRQLIFTEKLDGLNVRLFNGQAYTRDDSGAPHDAGYMALVKKWHAHKTAGNDLLSFYGEDVYAQHACQYGPVAEDAAFRMFAVATMTDDPVVLHWEDTVWMAVAMDILHVPSLRRYHIRDTWEIEGILREHMQEPSALGGECEGVVVRVADSFPLARAAQHMFKVVRPGHVQPDADHWRKRWQPREIIWATP